MDKNCTNCKFRVYFKNGTNACDMGIINHRDPFKKDLNKFYCCFWEEAIKSNFTKQSPVEGGQECEKPQPLE